MCPVQAAFARAYSFLPLWLVVVVVVFVVVVSCVLCGREIQRTLMELLNQLDGFEDLGQVKMVMATNRPGRH